MITFIILVIIWTKIPSFNDIFGIKKEMKWMSAVLGITLLLYIAWYIKVMIISYDLWVFMIAQFIFGIMAGINALILNGFIFHAPDYKHLTSITTLETKVNRLKILSSSSLCDSPTGITGGQTLSLSELLEDAQFIDCLFAHLADEFSVELLLALIEFKEFHDLMADDEEFMADIEPIISADSECILSRICLPEELPRSKIVHENYPEDGDNEHDHIHRYLGIANDLYHKYVSVGADLQVNLSHRHRQKMARFIQEYGDISNVMGLNASEQCQLFSLFNEASDELYRLLHGSHKRYITVSKYYLDSSSQIV